MSDRELVERAQRGERAAFDGLIGTWLRQVHAVVSAQLGPRAEVDDAVQDTFVTAWNRLGQLHDADAFGGWLLTIARNTALTWGRKLSRQRAAQLPDALTAPPPPTESERDDPALRSALATLSSDHREILHLKYQAGLSYADIAALLALSNDAVEKRLWRARQALLAAIERHNRSA